MLPSGSPVNGSVVLGESPVAGLPQPSGAAAASAPTSRAGRTPRRTATSAPATPVPASIRAAGSPWTPATSRGSARTSGPDVRRTAGPGAFRRALLLVGRPPHSSGANWATVSVAIHLPARTSKSLLRRSAVGRLDHPGAEPLGPGVEVAHIGVRAFVVPSPMLASTSQATEKIAETNTSSTAKSSPWAATGRRSRPFSSPPAATGTGRTRRRWGAGWNR